MIPALILDRDRLAGDQGGDRAEGHLGADLTIKVTGYQWKWGYDYIKGEGEGISFVSTLATPREQIEGKAPKGENYLLEVDNEMVVPVGKKVRVITTAADVIHAWWIPAFGAKQDAIPGFLRDIWFRAEKTGTFRGQCTELCGKEHALHADRGARGVAPRTTKWVGEQKKAHGQAAADDPNKTWDLKELVARGEKVYAANCVACHQATGQGTPAMKAPALAGYKIVVGPEETPIDTVLNGRPEHRDAGVQAAVEHRDRRGDHLHAQFLGQQGERCAARRSQGAKEIGGEQRHERSRRHDHGHAHDDHGHGHHGRYGGIMRWITTTNHKDIGTLYLWFSFIMFSIGGLMAVGIRLELFSPGLQFVDPDFFNQITTMHGLIMVFGAIMPVFVGFANWQIPMMIGAPDMAFARLNNWSFWLLPFAATLLVLSFFMPGGAPGVGWTHVRAAHGADGHRHGPHHLRRAPARHELDPRARSTSSPPSSTCARRG